jgi:hypothetical protein
MKYLQLISKVKHISKVVYESDNYAKVLRIYNKLLEHNPNGLYTLQEVYY